MKNILIAEFKNYKLVHNFIYNEPLKSWVNETNFKDYFKEDWNELMKVVDKIESFEDKNRCAKFNVNMEQSWIEIIDNRTSNEIVKIDANNKLLATYNAVVEFIEWYNKN